MSGDGLFDLRTLRTPTLVSMFDALAPRFGEPEDRLYCIIGRIIAERADL